MNNVAIIGYGGHSKVITDILYLNNYNILGYYDDKILGKNILGKIQDIDKSIPNFICAIGNNLIRKKITTLFKNLNWISAIHPSAIISKKSKIREGSVICANVVIQPDTIIGKHCIINTGSTIDHDCIINNYIHIAPGSTLCGNVNIGTSTFIGASTTIINNINIGSNNIIGAGSVIVKDIRETNILGYGVPFKIKKSL